MKTYLTTSKNSDRSLEARTTCCYQAASLPAYRGQPVNRASELRSFRKLSENYFAQEEPRNYFAEAAVFALIALTAALPIASSLHALAQLGAL